MKAVFAFAFFLGSSFALAAGQETYVCSVMDLRSREPAHELKIPLNRENEIRVGGGSYRLWFVNGGGGVQVYVYRQRDNKLLSYANISQGTLSFLEQVRAEISCNPARE